MLKKWKRNPILDDSISVTIFQSHRNYCFADLIIMQSLYLFIIVLFFFYFIFSIHGIFVQIKNGIFILDDQEYRALGVCLYPAHAANYVYIRRATIEAKSNGFILVRIVDIFESEYGKSDESLMSDRVLCHRWRTYLLEATCTIGQTAFYQPYSESY